MSGPDATTNGDISGLVYPECVSSHCVLHSGLNPCQFELEWLVQRKMKSPHWLKKTPLFCYYCLFLLNRPPRLCSREWTISHISSRKQIALVCFQLHIGLLSAKKLVNECWFWCIATPASSNLLWNLSFQLLSLATPSGLLLDWAGTASRKSKCATSLLHWDFKSLQPPLLAFSVQEKDRLDAALLCSGWWLLGYRRTNLGFFPQNVTGE